MASPHPLLTLAVVLVGSFSGGAVVMSVRSAQAQEVPPNVKTNELLYVPSGGLSIVGTSNRLLGRIAEVDGNAGLVLFNKDGGASVSFYAGPSGSLSFLAQDGASLALRGDRNSVNLSARARGVELALGTRISLREDGTGSRLTLRSPTGLNLLDLTADPTKLEILGKSSLERFKLTYTDEPSLTLRGARGEAGFEAIGSGKAAVRSGGKVVWQVPEGN